MASWRRSLEYGVPREGIEPAFTGSPADDSLFSACGRQVLAELQSALADEPVTLILTDADGLVLDRRSGDRSLLRALDAVHLAPGFAFSERTAGTNGLGLALADRVPTVVRHEEHYALPLGAYTCAAVPVLDPVTGRLEGAVNLTTRSSFPGGLLLALAQSAAGTASALMLARSHGRRPRPAPVGRVFRVDNEPAAGTVRELSRGWTDALAVAERGMRAGRVVAAVGEGGAGRATLLAQAQRRALPRARILSAGPPGPQDVEPWLALWSPELGKPHTAVVVRDVDRLPTWAAERLGPLLHRARGPQEDRLPGTPFSLTAETLEDVPAPLAGLVETVVHVPPLRERPDDVLVLARHAARRARGRDVALTPAAARALSACPWPGNVEQLVRAVGAAARRADVVDVRDLPAEVLSAPRRRLTRIETVERDAIVQVLTRPGTTVRQAAEELGLSRATLYRRLGQYGISAAVR
ncbi:MAG TPA: helix-turn-helix domain-containing protein [Mycobacteriales bacterium]|nr:helix-turn-helix domain-containing protein [Mycobacteriales bacterium]